MLHFVLLLSMFLNIVLVSFLCRSNKTDNKLVYEKLDDIKDIVDSL